MRRFIFALFMIIAASGLVLAQSPIDVEITPDDPIVVPGTPPGGWIDFTVSIENTTPEMVSFDAWITVDLPFGTQFEIVSPVEISLPGGFYFEKDLSLFMPWIAPEGEYTVVVYVGDYPDDIWDSDGLTVIKEGFGDSEVNLNGWQVVNTLPDAEVKPIQGGFTDSDVEIEIQPDEPIVLPAEGGWFDFYVSIENTTLEDQYFDAWIDVELADGYTFTIVSPMELMLPAGYFAEADLWFWMPWFLMEGEYSFTAYVGDYPDDIWDSDNLTIIKEGWSGDNSGRKPFLVKGDLASMDMAPISGFADSDVEIEILPDEPIVIPAEGDWFSFEVFVENTTPDEVYFDAWINIDLPWGFTFEVVSPMELTIPGGYQAQAELWLYMPFFSPEGDYVMTAYVGDYPDDVWDTDMLTITKEPFNGALKQMPGWLVKGDLTPENIMALEMVPEETALYSAYPNPFNPSTVICYQLNRDNHVLLNVYDVSGRLVTTLVDGFRSAGAHSVTFDASSLVSGVYIYSLQAGDFHANGKMLLLK